MSEKHNSREKLLKELGLPEDADIHVIRQRAFENTFVESRGKKVIIMMGPYPYLIVGTIQKVMSDFVFIRAEATNITELDGELFRVHFEQIEVFFIEDGKHEIPTL
ncbi:MAG TPA: hypothetical protein VEY51_20445 [Chondromyces sp.]|nr:hypothetical protein [Chondromyces sp.]